MAARAEPNPRRDSIRFVAAMAVAAAVALVAGQLLWGRAAIELSRGISERRAMVSLLGLADLLGRTDGDGAKMRQVVAQWDAPSEARTRVVLTEGISLEASSDPKDVGELAAPRHLQRSEKDLFDRNARLRTAVETNRDEGAARKPEIEVDADVPGQLSLATPVEKDGAVIGMVQQERAVTTAPAAASWAWAMGLWIAAVALAAGVAFGLRGRRSVSAIVTSVLLLAAVAVFSRHAFASLRDQRRAVETSVAQELNGRAARAQALIGSLSLRGAPPLAPDRWDTDAFRRPRELLSAQGAVNEPKLAAELEAGGAQLTKSAFAISAVALLVLLAIGLGAVGAFFATVTEYRQAYYYVLPAMVGMIVLVFFPFFYGIALSFTDANIYNSNQSIAETWIGLKNYWDILSDVGIARHAADGAWLVNYLNFYYTLGFTIVWTVTNVAIGVTGGLILALLLNTKGLVARPVYRVLLILPWAMPNYITSLIWKGMFHQQFGVINQLLRILGVSPISWFDKPFTSFLTALTTNGWLSFPFMMVVSLGALQSIPAELYEAAKVDGASRWQQFRAITLPALRPALIPAVILSVVWTFNMFNVIYLVTGGEPSSSTEILITQAYKFAFEKYRYGYAAAYSTVIFGILVIYGSIQNRLSRATEAA